MGTIDLPLATALRDSLGLRRAVETGTYRGRTARALAPLFERVVTVELSRALYESAAAALSDISNVEVIHGHSAEVLAKVVRPLVPTFYFLDGHWSAGKTAGSSNECPVLDELAAIGPAHRDDCLVIDDARLFTSSPPPPHDPAQWPTILDVFDALRLQRPQHTVTLLFDQIIAVPSRAKPLIDEYGARMHAADVGLRQRALDVLVATRERIAHARAASTVTRQRSHRS